MMLVIKSPNLLMVSKLAVNAKALKRIAAYVGYPLAALLFSVHVHAAYNGPWSGYKTPHVPNANITIDAGDSVYYDSTVDDVVGNLTVNGAFYCTESAYTNSGSDIRKLTVSSVMVMGSNALFECGASETNRFKGVFTLQFQESASCVASPNGGGYTGDPATRRADCQGFEVMSGGKLNLFGNFGSNTWTKVTAAAGVGATDITAANTAGWKAGDKIVFASAEVGNHFATYTDFMEERARTVTVNDIAQNKLTLDEALEHALYGSAPYDYPNNPITYQYGAPLIAELSAKLKDSTTPAAQPLRDQNNNLLIDRITAKQGQKLKLDERTEVANTTRNIIFKGTLIDLNAAPQKYQWAGMHMMFMNGSGSIHIDGVEIVNAGRAGELARYPMHWHMAGNREGDFIRNSSIHNSFNRCITIHQTNNVVIEDNVCVDITGHAYFLEDGNETGNRFIDNLAILVKPVIDGNHLLYSDTIPSDFKFSGSAAFWISNPNNIFIGNSASSAGSGYWYALKDEDHKVQGLGDAPDKAPMGVFSGNTAHTVNIGYTMDGGPNGACNTEFVNNVEIVNPRNPCVGTRQGDFKSNLAGNAGYFPAQAKLFLVDDFTAYKATGLAFWMVSGNAGVVTNSVLADSGTNGALVFSDDFTNSLIVGASAGLTDAQCVALQSPFTTNPGSFGLYDGPSIIRDVHFAGYARANCSALLPFSLTQSAALRVPNHQAFSNITFEDNVYAGSGVVIPRVGLKYEQKHPQKDNYAAGLYDRDGAVSGVAGGNVTIVPNMPMATYQSTTGGESCSTSTTIPPITTVTADTAVCPGRYGLMYIDENPTAATTTYPAIPYSLKRVARVGSGYGADVSYSYTPAINSVSTTVLSRADAAATISPSAGDAVIALSAHGFSANDPIRFKANGQFPSEIIADEIYYVIPVDADTFKISAMPNGAAVGIGASYQVVVSPEAIFTRTGTVFSKYDAIQFQNGVNPVPNGMIVGLIYYTVPIDNYRFSILTDQTTLGGKVNVALGNYTINSVEGWYSHQFSFPINRLNNSDIAGADDDFSYEIAFLNQYQFRDDTVAGTVHVFTPEVLFLEQNQWSPWVALKIATNKACNIYPDELDRSLGAQADLNYFMDSVAGINVLHYRLKATKPMSEFLNTRGKHGGYFDEGDRKFYFNSVKIVCGDDVDNDKYNTVVEGIIGTASSNADTDGDGVSDYSDAFPTNYAESADSDYDGVGNNVDTNDDNDGLTDAEEVSLGTNALNSLDPPKFSLLSPVYYVGIDDVNFSTSTIPSRYLVWNFLDGSWSSPAGEIDKQLSDIIFLNGPLCSLVGSTVDCGAGIFSGASKIRSSSNQACALLTTGAVQCWEGNNVASRVTISGAGYADIAVGVTTSCAVNGISTYCWDNLTKAPVYTTEIATAALTAASAVAVGDSHVCVIDGVAVKCWGDSSSNKTNPGAASSPLRIAAGSNHTCLLMGAGGYLTPSNLEVKCWGDTNLYQTTVPAMLAAAGSATPIDIRAAGNSTCAVISGSHLAQNTIKCWPIGIDSGLTGSPSDSDGDGVSDFDEITNTEGGTAVTNPQSVDTDGDGSNDNADAFPLNATESVDTDDDGTGNNADTDDDNDTALDATDNCVLVANTNQLNAEGDALGDACDADDDNDLVEDSSDTDGFTKELTAAADTYSPTSSGDVLSFFTVTGLASNDTITTLGGNDWIDGGTGSDSMNGGAGNDTYVVDAAGDTVNEAASAGTDTVRSSVAYTITDTDVENLTLTGSSAVAGTGNASANVIDGSGNAAANALTGGAGNDTYVINSGDTITETNTTINGIDTVVVAFTATINNTSLENLTLTGSANVNATGNASVNVITGNAGNNSLNGAAGADTMLGGAGNDIYIVDNANDVVTEFASEGTDLVNSSVTYTIEDADVENLTLSGASAINATGNASNNTLTGNSALNTLTGGLGDDIYVVSATDVVVENTSEGTDLVQSAVVYTITDTDVENLTLTGGGSVNATGNASANTLVGNTGANTLIGKEGSDTLTGGAGIDKFVMDDVLTPSTVTDFVKGTDKVVVDISDVGAGDGDATVEGGLVRASSGGFSGAMATNELVIFTTNIVGAVDTTSAATTIGSASTTMTAGVKKIFVVDNGTNSYVYRFTSAANDATVSDAELVLLATLTSVNDSGTGDYLFQL